MAEATQETTRQPTIESLTAENIHLNDELTAAHLTITDLTEQLANADAVVGEAKVVVVSHEGKQYRVLGKQFNIKGKVIKAADLGKDKESLQYLVDTESELLQLVVKKTAKKAEAAE